MSTEQVLPLAEGGNASAQDEMGDRCRVGSKEVAQDAAQALAWYRKAVAHGCRDAEVELGSAYELGNGVPVNHVQAATWYQTAFNHGSMPAGDKLYAMRQADTPVPPPQMEKKSKAVGFLNFFNAATGAYIAANQQSGGPTTIEEAKNQGLERTRQIAAQNAAAQAAQQQRELERQAEQRQREEAARKAQVAEAAPAPLTMQTKAYQPATERATGTSTTTTVTANASSGSVPMPARGYVPQAASRCPRRSQRAFSSRQRPRPPSPRTAL